MANPLKEQETLVYGLGVIKLLASSPALREQMVSTDVMVLMNNTLKVCCEECATSQPTAGEMTHMRNILIQVCECVHACVRVCGDEAWVKGLGKGSQLGKGS